MAAELSRHERGVIQLQFWLYDWQTRMAKEVLEEYGGDISLTDIRFAELRAVKKLLSPHALYTYNIFDYIGMPGMYQGWKTTLKWQNYTMYPSNVHNYGL